MSASLAPSLLTQQTFTAIRELIFDVAGITITPDKEELVKARLGGRLRALKLPNYEHYLLRVRNDAVELSNMVDMLTTNKTNFFREIRHFQYLSQHVFPRWNAERKPRQIWSAGCSSGEEPYTLSMHLLEELPTLDVRILATDLSTRVLAQAKEATYTEECVSSIPDALRAKYLRATGKSEPKTYKFTPNVTSKVSFARLNLMTEWPMRGQFDLILCRNVMIYFDDNIRTTLARRFADKTLLRMPTCSSGMRRVSILWINLCGSSNPQSTLSN